MLQKSLTIFPDVKVRCQMDSDLKVEFICDDTVCQADIVRGVNKHACEHLTALLVKIRLYFTCSILCCVASGRMHL